MAEVQRQRRHRQSESEVTLNCFKYSADLVGIFSVEGVVDYAKIPESG